MKHFALILFIVVCCVAWTLIELKVVAQYDERQANYVESKLRVFQPVSYIEDVHGNKRVVYHQTVFVDSLEACQFFECEYHNDGETKIRNKIKKIFFVPKK